MPQVPAARRALVGTDPPALGEEEDSTAAAKRSTIPTSAFEGRRGDMC